VRSAGIRGQARSSICSHPAERWFGMSMSRVCVCVCVCVCTYIHTYIHTYIWHTHTHVHTYIHKYIRIHTYTHTHTHTRTHTHLGGGMGHIEFVGGRDEVGWQDTGRRCEMR
jgi:hypothetical protein